MPKNPRRRARHLTVLMVAIAAAAGLLRVAADYDPSAPLSTTIGAVIRSLASALLPLLG